jgi:hypothetical protein
MKYVSELGTVTDQQVTFEELSKLGQWGKLWAQFKATPITSLSEIF